MPNNMRVRGQDISTDFGELKRASFETPLARLQKTSIEKAATIFDKYDVRVTIESKAGHTNQSYTEVLNAMKDAGLLYREDRRFTIKPDRDCIDILIEKEDMPIIAELNKTLADSGFKFIVSENLPEYIQPRTIVTDEFTLDRPKNVKASKKIAGDITYTVRLEDGTVGKISSDTLGGQSADDFIGEVMNVHLRDENGNPIEVEGVLVEVLEENEGWQGIHRSKKTAANEWVSKDGKIKIYETFHDFQIEHVPSGESRGMGDGVDMFSNEDGEPIDVGTPEFEAQMANYVNNPELMDAYFPDKVEGSKKMASHQFSPRQIEFLFSWAQNDVNFGPNGLREFAEGTNSEDVYNSLPDSIKESDGESLKTEIPWSEVETGSIKRGFNVVNAIDMQSGARCYMLYPESTNLGTANLVLRFWTNRWDANDYKELTGATLSEGEEPDSTYLNEVTNDLAKETGLIFINPSDRQGYVFDFLGEELYKDADGNVYLTGAVESTEETVKKAPKGKSRKSVSDLQDKKVAYDQANDDLDLMGTLESIATGVVATLRTEQNTPEVDQDIMMAFEDSPYRATVGDFTTVFEHGQWWINGVSPNGDAVQFSVVDAEGPNSYDGFDFEQVT